MAKELTANFNANASKFSAGVQKLKTDLTNLNKSLDENKKAISETNKEMKQLEAEQKKLAKEIDENGGATKEQSERMDELKTAIAQTKVKSAELKTEQAELKVDIKNTTKQLEEQKNQAKQSGKALDTVKSAAADLGKTLATTATGFSAAVGALYAMTASAGATADDINTLSKQYGLSTEQIQKFKYATDLIDVSLEAYTASIARNIRSMVAYQNGTTATVQAYDALGVSVIDANGKLRDSQTVYNEIIAALGKIEDETERDSLAMTILGRNAQQLNPLILGGAEALEELGKQAKNLGLILPQENLDNLNAFNDKIDTLKANMNGLKMVVADSFANSFDSFFEAGDDFLAFIQELKKDGTLDEMAMGLADTLATLVNLLKTAIDIGWKFRNVISAGVVALIAFKTAISLGNIISGTVSAIKGFTTATKAATTAQQIFNATGAANPYVLIGSLITSVVFGIGTFIASTNNATESLDELKQSAAELSNQAQDTADKADTLKDVLDKYEDISNSTVTAAEKTETLKTLQEQLNNAYGETSTVIDLVNGSYEENIRLLQEATEAERERARIKAQAAVNKNNKAQRELTGETDIDYTVGVSAVKSGDLSNPNITVGTSYLGMGTSATLQTVQIGGDTYAEKAQAYKDYLDYLELIGEKESEAYTKAAEKFDEYSDLAEQAADAEKLLAAATEESTDSINDNTDAGNDNARTIEDISDAAETASDNVRTLASETKTLSAALEEQAENGKISVDTALDLIDKGYAQILQIDAETNAIRINAQAYRDLMQAKIDARKVEIQTTISEAREEIIGKLGGGWGGLSAFGTMVSGAEAADEQVQSLYNNIQALEAELGVLDSMSVSVDTTVSDYYSGSLGKSDSENDYYSEAYQAYKTEADKKLELINREIDAKKKLRDETISAIDDEIEARKRLNEDNDLEKQINEVKAQLKYGQLDEFSRGQLQNKLSNLYKQQSETEWQRQKQDEKKAADEQYETDVAQLKEAQTGITESVNTFKQIMDSLAQGITNVSNIVNNNVTKNNTANINLANNALSMAQITKAVRDALMDDIVI